MACLAFDPNRQAIRLAGRDFLLALNVHSDGTGLARLSEVGRDGRPVLLCAYYQGRPGGTWCFKRDWSYGLGETPRAAAAAFIRQRLGLPESRS